MQHRFITAAEERYRGTLTEECRRLFESIGMPSHDHLHHERVWENASLLLKHLSDASLTDDPRIAEKAIVAAFFHDTGMTVNRGADHGRESRRLCAVFLANSDFSAEERKEILDAVERHDDKDYQATSDPASLAAIITVADDMDAFGETGIERYEEIYSMRGITSDRLPQMIISNVRSRLRHLEATYRMFPGIVDDQRARARIVIDYFRQKTK